MTARATTLRTGTVAAAGALLWRRKGDKLQVALVHRPKYDDWSWAKGKLDPGETWAQAAAREVLEETGFRPRLGIPLPRSVYAMQRGTLKEIRYWAAEVIGGSGELENEIDEVAWLTPPQAQRRLTYVRDALQLQTLVDADRAGTLQTWPLVVVRHGDSVSRKHWDEPDALRPLDGDGRKQAAALVPLLAAYGIERVVTSPSTRCLTTVMPYAADVGIPVHTKAGLSEETFEQDPKRAIHNVKRLLKRAEPVALCTHRPVLPTVLDRLRRTTEPDSEVHEILAVAAEDGMAKGEALVCQISGSGSTARVMSVERHTPS